jgi:WD40 repeat protein
MHPLRDTFLSGSLDDKICLWDFRTSHCEAMMQIANVPSIAFDPTGATFAVAFDNRQIRIYDIMNFHRGPIHIWDVLKGDLVLQAMLGHEAAADGFGLAASIRKGMIWLQLQYSEDGQWLFIGTGTWRYHYIMNVRTGELSESISGHAELLASPNMRRFYGRGLAPLGNRLISPGGFVPTLQASASPTTSLSNRATIVMTGDATGKMHFFEGETARQLAMYEILPSINATKSMDDSAVLHLVSWLQWNPKYRILAAVTGKHLSFWQP